MVVVVVKVYKEGRAAVIMSVLVDQVLCNGCGTCVNNCPQEVFELKDGKSNVINGDNCLECHLCEVSCEHGAITIEENWL